MNSVKKYIYDDSIIDPNSHCMIYKSGSQFTKGYTALKGYRESLSVEITEE